MIGNNNVQRNPISTQIPETVSTTKVTRYDIINKNYIFPQDKFTIQSSYNANYYDNSKQRVRTEKTSHPVNQVLPTGKFQANSSYLQDFVNTEPVRRQLVKHEGELKIGGKFQGQSSYLQSYSNQGNFQRQERVTFPQNKIMPQGNFQTVSTYAQNYHNNPVQQIPKIKPIGELKVAGGTLQGQSTYVSHYYNKELAARSQKIKYPQNQVLPQGHFEGNSTYGQAYLNKEKVKKNDLVKHEGELKIGGQFYGESSYAQNYFDKGLPSRQQKYQLPNNKVLPEGKFEEDTTYGANYVKTTLPRVQKFKPQGELKIAGGSLQTQSSYGLQYVRRQMGQNSDRQKVVYPQNQVIPKGRFVGSSTYNQKYIQSPIMVNKPYKMEGELKVGGKFEGNSNYDESYFQKSIPNRNQKVVLPQNLVIPKGKFEQVSTYSGNYINNPIQPNIIVKPQGQLKLPGGLLEGRSTYQMEYYNKQNVLRRERQKSPENDVIPKGKFIGNSTYENTYLGTSVERNPQVRPQNNLNVGNTRFEGISSYGIDYESGMQGPRYLNRQNDYLSSKK